MESDEPTTIKLAPDGYPILDQFSEAGFVDCAFRIVNLVSSDREHRFHLAASHVGEPVGFDVVVVKGIRGGFDDEMDLIADHVYRGGVRFLRSGPESDRLVTALATLYGLAAQPRTMVDTFSFTGIALHKDDVDMETQPIKIKLFGNDGDDVPEDAYFESFFNLVLVEGFVYWNEKDPDYRAALIGGLSVPSDGAPNGVG
jgi:hypothetical protein